MTIAPLRTETKLDAAVERATTRLLELQHPDGWWVGELESNATMIAQHLFWHHFLGLRTPELDRKIANELLGRQRGDGTWAIWFEGPADLSTTVEAYAALKLAGVEPGPRARDYIRAEGGVSRARVFTKCFLALLGHWPWQWIPRLPPEVILLPPDGPFSVYNFSCWARQTVVPLSIVQALRPVRPAAIDLQEIGARPGQTKPPPRPGPIRRVAFATAERWVRDRQAVTVKGDWAVRRPDLAPGGWAFEFENDLYPDVDDTAVVALALRGLDLGGDPVDRGLAWAAGMQSRSGGWGAFDVDNEALWLYKLPFCDFGKVTDEPSADVSAHALEALAPEPGYAAEVDRGLEWLLGEQERDGSWFGRWGGNQIYGTGAALPALEAC